MAAELAQRLQQRELEIIDFGCGTGLLGEALREPGFVNVDGADISTWMPEMLLPIKSGGLIVLTMNGTNYESGGLQQTFRQMQDCGLWSIHKLEELNYMIGLVRPGWLLVSVKH